MTITATFVRRIEGWRGHACLYRLSETVGADCDSDNETDHVIISAADVPYSGPETYIFPADANGEVLSWAEMHGSTRGTLSHDAAIEAAGWEVPK